MTTKTEHKADSKKQPSSGIVWFEIPADNMERAKSFYSELFGWKIEPFRNMPDYWQIDTGGDEDNINGGMLRRKHPAHQITNYINVASVTKSSAKVEKLGGKICMPKMTVPNMGYFAVCQDTDGNVFGLWETDENAKELS